MTETLNVTGVGGKACDVLKVTLRSVHGDMVRYSIKHGDEALTLFEDGVTKMLKMEDGGVNEALDSVWGAIFTKLHKNKVLDYAANADEFSNFSRFLGKYKLADEVELSYFQRIKKASKGDGLIKKIRKMEDDLADMCK